MKPVAYLTAHEARKRRNMPRQVLIVLGLLGILAAHAGQLPAEYRPLIEIASEAAALIGAVLYERRSR
jgi:hypothetical protein